MSLQQNGDIHVACHVIRFRIMVENLKPLDGIFINIVITDKPNAL
ncbi:hypothetical protein F925_01792 [Acinetobacter lwoffii NCTC 5866 = CIP 64.10 = NIPH 512]|nr:hypothetical protein F925_01792 [Acinetobacter lwoffii NCTC 5866 = CIP 64.10 = NIPH 512]